MRHFAISDGTFSPAEAELGSALSSEAFTLDGFVPLGLVLVPQDLTNSIVVLALTAGLDIDQWWAR